MSCLVINGLDGIENKTYLELGILDNFNFNKILSKRKMSVDTNGNGMFTGTTDMFFETISDLDSWDIIFIDANHDYGYVLRDFNNAIKHCNEWLFIHDMVPPSEEHCKSEFCSDSYKLLYYLKTSTNYEIYPMNENMGLTLIKMPVLKINPPKELKLFTYDEFRGFIGSIHLYSWQEIIEIIN